jgi:hypothetical protein
MQAHRLLLCLRLFAALGCPIASLPFLGFEKKTGEPGDL